jgi:hypothetical protein
LPEKVASMILSLLSYAFPIILTTETLPLPSGANFQFTNSTGIFIPSIPFPAGALQRLDGQSHSIEELHSLRIENASAEFHFPEAAELSLSYWRIPSFLCPSPSYLLNAEFHITSRTTFSPTADICVFVDPRGIGHFLTILTKSAKPIQIQFYVNNSIIPYYECEGIRAQQKLRCSSPFDQPFFARIVSPPGNSLALEIEYSVAYGSDLANGCQLSRIPTTFAVSGEPPDPQLQIQCVTLMQEAVHLVLKFGALGTILFMVAVLFQRLGYWNFCEWVKMPGGPRVVKAAQGMVAVESSMTTNRMAVFGLSFIDGDDSDSSDLSEPLAERSPFART